MSPGGARAALWHGAAAFGVLLVLGEVVALLRAAGPLDPTAGAVLRAGALAPSFVHRVPVEMLLVDASGPGGLFGGAVEVGFTVRVALLLATAGAGWLLVRGGRAAGGPLGGPLVAAPYAALSVASALLADGSDPAILLGAGFADPGQAAAHPSLWWSALAPGAIALACGVAGGLASSRDAARSVWAAAAGAWRMSWMLAAGGTAGILVVVALHPNATRAFLDSAGARGWAGAAAVLLVTALLLPNAGIGAAVAAMGVPIELRAGESTCVLITLGEPTCGEVSLDVAPGYLLFVVVPLAATLSGGWWAARRRGSSGAAAAAAAGAAAGALFAPIVVALAYLASVGYRFAGPLGGALGESGVALGPPLVPTFLAALAWGVVGGVAGGLAAHRLGRGSGPGDGPGPNESPGSCYAAGGGAPALLSWKRR